MKVWAVPVCTSLIVAVLALLSRPLPSVLFGFVALCLGIVIVVAWSCAIRTQSFSVFGFVRLSSSGPTVKLTSFERLAAQLSLSALFGAAVGGFALVLFGVA